MDSFLSIVINFLQLVDANFSHIFIYITRLSPLYRVKPFEKTESIPYRKKNLHKHIISNVRIRIS